MLVPPRVLLAMPRSTLASTRMANVVQDPEVHPEAIVGDSSKPNPPVTFKKEDIAFTYGSKWKQRYFTKRGDDYFAFPAPRCLTRTRPMPGRRNNWKAGRISRCGA